MQIIADSHNLEGRWGYAGSSRDGIGWSIAASLVLHIVLCVAIGLYSISPPTIRPVSGISVQILTPNEFETVTRPARSPAPEKPSSLAVLPKQPSTTPPPAPPPAQSAPAQPDAGSRSGPLIRATQLFAASVLAESGSRQVRETLPLLAREDRIMQLCNIEAVEQVRRSRPEFQPDYVVADAMMDTELHRFSLEADGGAVRSQENWFNLKYRCTVMANFAAVSSFEFFVGEAIPKKEWRRHHLTGRDLSPE